jgi:hypothetical protein
MTTSGPILRIPCNKPHRITQANESCRRILESQHEGTGPKRSFPRRATVANAMSSPCTSTRVSPSRSASSYQSGRRLPPMSLSARGGSSVCNCAPRPGRGKSALRVGQSSRRRRSSGRRPIACTSNGRFDSEARTAALFPIARPPTSSTPATLHRRPDRIGGCADPVAPAYLPRVPT